MLGRRGGLPINFSLAIISSYPFVSACVYHHHLLKALTPFHDFAFLTVCKRERETLGEEERDIYISMSVCHCQL